MSLFWVSDSGFGVAGLLMTDKLSGVKAEIRCACLCYSVNLWARSCQTGRRRKQQADAVRGLGSESGRLWGLGFRSTSLTPDGTADVWFLPSRDKGLFV